MWCWGGQPHLLNQMGKLWWQITWQKFWRSCGLRRNQELVKAKGYGFGAEAEPPGDPVGLEEKSRARVAGGLVRKEEGSLEMRVWGSLGNQSRSSLGGAISKEEVLEAFGD